jgi:hypothetical protein
MNTDNTVVSTNFFLNLLRNGFLVIYGGSVPATPEAAITSQPVLARFTLTNAPTTLSGKVFTIVTTDETTPVLTTGTATFYRLQSSDGATVVAQGTVGVSGSGADMTLNDTNLVVGDNVTRDTLNLTYVEAAAGTGRMTTAAAQAMGTQIAATLTSNTKQFLLYSNDDVVCLVPVSTVVSTAGVISINPTSATNPATASGTLTRWEFKSGANTSILRLSGTIGLAGSGADMIVDDADIAAGDNINVGTMQITVQ